ncbi:hypothetical protein SprV_0702459700 [Sparganum proliferum]
MRYSCTAADIRHATEQDPIIRQAITYVQTCWPTTALAGDLRQLSVVDSCLMFADRLVIPSFLRSTVLRHFHAAHPGASRMKSIARCFAYWPGTDGNIDDLVRRCTQSLLSAMLVDDAGQNVQPEIDRSNQTEGRSADIHPRRIRDARESKLKQKLTTLSEKNASLCHDNVVHNLSSKQLTAEQIKVLSHDACFNTTDAQPIDFIAAAEAVIREAPITEENRNLLRQRISSRLMSYKKRNMLSKAENEALRTLKADKSIVILPADKGRSTVVLNKEDYVNKVEALLGDRTAYIPCEGDTTKTLMSKINKDLASLRKSKAITQLDWQRMKPKDSAIARFYGLPKAKSNQESQDIEEELAMHNGYPSTRAGATRPGPAPCLAPTPQGEAATPPRKSRHQPPQPMPKARTPQHKTLHRGTTPAPQPPPW